MSPPLSDAEVNLLLRSINKKGSYFYTCDQPPICNVCNKQLCRTRKFGIGNDLKGDPGVSFGRITKIETDPPTWIWDINGYRIELSTEQLMNQRLFNAVSLERLNKWPRTLKPAVWRDLVAEHVDEAELVEAPPEASTEGQLAEHLRAFARDKAPARVREEILLGKPYFEGGLVFFQGMAFQSYLERRGVKVLPRRIWSWLRKEGAGHGSWTIKGSNASWWSVPAPPEQTEDYDVPKQEEVL
jgi:hypothetical protein